MDAESGVVKRVGALGSVAAALAASLVAATLAWSPAPADAVAGFGDIDTGRYYTNAVQWAVDNDITGINGACFLPDAAVSRGDAAVYIWNMEGQPLAPTHSFVDITDESQNAAVSWMSHNGITTGTSETTFEPDTTSTRAHLVTFLHRLAGKAPAHPFVDVLTSWQQDSVSWAYNTGITTGTSETTFAPDTALTRAHLVTFLYRYQGEPEVTVDPETPPCDPTDTDEPTDDTEPPPNPLGAFTAVSAGGSSSCGLRASGTIECWGSTVDGATRAPEGEFTTISTGSGHSCAVRTSGTIECWGQNYYGETDPPAGEFTTVSAGAGHSCGVRTDDSIECWGWNDYYQADAPAGEFTTVSAGYWHSCGVLTDATIECWGSNYYGQADAPTGTFSAISATQSYSCGLRTNATIECWGDNDATGTNPNAGARTDTPAGTFTSVSAGDLYSCGVRTNGSIECWGYNSTGHYGDTGQDDPPAKEFTSVAAGFWHSCGVRINGTIECWGINDHGQTNVPVDYFTTVSSGGSHSLIGYQLLG